MSYIFLVIDPKMLSNPPFPVLGKGGLRHIDSCMKMWVGMT